MKERRKQERRKGERRRRNIAIPDDWEIIDRRVIPDRRNGERRNQERD